VVVVVVVVAVVVVVLVVVVAVCGGCGGCGGMAVSVAVVAVVAVSLCNAGDHVRARVCELVCECACSGACMVCSNGGIMGSVYMGLTQDVQMGCLGVGGGSYSVLVRPLIPCTLCRVVSRG
jgi:hypothetical protein